MEKDFSKEIYDKYYNSKDKILIITLKDNTFLEGILVSFMHGDPEDGEPFINKWHFVDKDEMDEYNKGLDVALENNQDKGRIIAQKDIKDVRFKK